MSWVSKQWKKVKKYAGTIAGTLLAPGIGTVAGAMSDAYSAQKKAMQQQADIAEHQAAQQAAYYQQQQELAEKEEAEAKAAAAATKTNMKRGLSDFLFNNNLLGLGGGKSKLN